MGVLAVLQLAAGLALQLVVIALVGAGRQTDAFVAGQTLPLLMVAVLATPLASAWLPRMSIAAGDPELLRQQQGIAQGQVLLGVGGLSLACAATTPLWLPALFPGLDAESTSLAATIAQILCLGALLNGHTLLLTTACRARGTFIAPEVIVAVTAAAAVVAAIVVVPAYGVMGAAWISTVRAIVACAALYALAGRPPVRPLAALGDAESWRLLRPLLAGSSIYKTSPLVDRFWASQAAAGGLTVLGLAYTGVSAVAQVVERVVSVPAGPRLARLSAAGDHAGMLRLVRKSIHQAAAATVVVLAGLIAVRPWLAGVVESFGFDAAVAGMLWWLVTLMLGFLHVAACGSVPVTAFIAIGDSQTPVRISIVAFLLGIGLKSVGFVYFGLPGLAIATSIYYLGNLVAVSTMLRRRLIGKPQ